MRTRPVILTTFLLLTACGKSTAPTASVPATAPQPDSGAETMFRSLDGRWAIMAIPMELHYSGGRLLGRGAEAVLSPIVGGHLFIIAAAGEMDDANHQVPITSSALPATCHDVLVGGGNFKSDLEERFNASERLMGGIENGTSNALNPAAFRAEILSNVRELTPQLIEQRDETIKQCQSSAATVSTLTLKNLSDDPSNSIRPRFVTDSGNVIIVSFIRKLTAAETADIENAHATYGQMLESSNKETAAQILQYYNELIAKVGDFSARHGSGNAVPPVAQSVGQAADTNGPTTNLPHPVDATVAAVNASPVGQDAASRPSGPSFDCGKASTSIEKMICADSSLSAADSALAVSYAKAKAKAAGIDSTSLRNSQRQFLQARNGCATTACIADAYRSRAAELDKLVSNP
jgi:uncharacterized protein YecT (DUF1311 family)